MPETERSQPATHGGARAGAGRRVGSRNVNHTREIRTSLFEAAEQSDWGKDPDNPDAPGTLTKYLTHIANNHPGKTKGFPLFCALTYT
jgi:hypothetical protein